MTFRETCSKGDYLWYIHKPVVDTWAASPARFLSPSQVRLTGQSPTPHCWSLPRSLQAETRLHHTFPASKSDRYPPAHTVKNTASCFSRSEGQLCNNPVTSPIYQAVVLHSDIARDKCIKMLMQHSKAEPRQGNKQNWQLRAAPHQIH